MWWNHYKRWAEKNALALDNMEGAFHQLLLWVPASHPESETGQLREALWGVLQLHQLMRSLAVSRCETEQAYGTTVGLESDSSFPLAMRVGISAVQTLWPILQELCRDSSRPEETLRRQARVRSNLEHIRFFLRIGLLVSYWRRSRDTEEAGNVQPGIMIGGGMFQSTRAPIVGQEMSRIARLTYSGRRTGRRLVDNICYSSPTKYSRLRTLLAELLYCLRPLLTARADADGESTWKTWIQCLVIDVFSLLLLESDDSKANEETKSEVSRRKMRLFLYVLRDPVWNGSTRPCIESTTNTLRRIPLVGSLGHNYVWELVMFWRSIKAEEG